MTKAYALLSTYPPSGLATFSAALFANLRGPGDHVGVVRVLDEPVPEEPAPWSATSGLSHTGSALRPG